MIYQIHEIYGHSENQALEVAAVAEDVVEALVRHLGVALARHGQVGQLVQCSNGSHRCVVKRSIVTEVEILQLCVIQ